MNKIFVLIAVLFLATLSLLIFENDLFFSPQEIIKFADGKSYSQEEINSFFAISDEEYSEAKNSLFKEQSIESEKYSINSLSCFSESQELPSKGQDPSPTSPLPSKPGKGIPDDSCFWYALLLAKQEKFGDVFTYQDLDLVLSEAKSLGVYQNPNFGGGRGTPLPAEGTPPKKFMDDLMARINYIDNLALSLGGGGGNGGDSNDGLIIITPGSLGIKENKEIIKKASDEGDGLVLSFICKTGGSSSGFGHAVNVPKGGVTPNPSCNSIKFKVINPNGEVEVDSNGLVINSDPAGVPAGCGPGQTTHLESILIIESAPMGSQMPSSPVGLLSQ